MLHPIYQHADLQQQLGFLSDPLEVILFREIRPLKMNSFWKDTHSTFEGFPTQRADMRNRD